jgi:hypothetical protein
VTDPYGWTSRRDADAWTEHEETINPEENVMRGWCDDGSFALSEDDKESLQAVPEHLRGGLMRYVENGIPPGSFLTAVVSNDLFEAMGRADEISRLNLLQVIRWLYNNAPRACYGSAGQVRAWLAMHQEQQAKACVAPTEPPVAQ